VNRSAAAQPQTVDERGPNREGLLSQRTGWRTWLVPKYQLCHEDVLSLCRILNMFSLTMNFGALFVPPILNEHRQYLREMDWRLRGSESGSSVSVSWLLFTVEGAYAFTEKRLLPQRPFALSKTTTYPFNLFLRFHPPAVSLDAFRTSTSWS
jgi:hypothetical protein